MKKEVSPVVVVVAVIAVLAVIVWFVWHAGLITTPAEQHPNNGDPHQHMPSIPK